MSSLNEEEYLFKGKLEYVPVLSPLLNSLLDIDEVALIIFTERGIRVTCESQKCLQGSAFIPKDWFSEYSLAQRDSCPVVSCSLSLPLLLDSIGLSSIDKASENMDDYSSSWNENGVPPGMATVLKMVYPVHHSSLQLVVEDCGVSTECQISTIENTNMHIFEMKKEETVGKVVIDAELLRDLWCELDLTSQVIEITISPEEPYFRISTSSTLGQVNTDIHKDSEKISLFTCEETQNNQYKTSFLKSMIKALNQSSKTSIRVNDQGLICIQHMLNLDQFTGGFIEFFCLANIS